MNLLEGSWLPVRDADPRAFGLYLRHYSSKKGRARRPHKRWGPNGRRFIGNGEHILLITLDGRAVFGWRRQDRRMDAQTGIECCIFRNEGPLRSSALIREAVELAWARWPGSRLFTFVDPSSIRSSNPGFCFLAAGWRRLEERTARGLVILEILPEVAAP